MAQTKRKRQTKHRGNAAGMIESRGGNSRQPSSQARAKDPKASAYAKRQERMNRAPTWQSAVNKAGLASVVFFLFILLILREPVGGAVGLALITFLIYVPLSFYTDRTLYRRNQRKQAEARGARAAGKAKGKRP